MVCLIRDKYKEELEYYTKLLGSEKRAYAVLCCNNGFTLDKTKDGKPSQLYNDLLKHYDGDVKKALIKKSQLFTSDFTNDYGKWYDDGFEISEESKNIFDGNGEPLLHNVESEQAYFGSVDNKILLKQQEEGIVTTFEQNNYTNEMQAIKDKAIANGTFMKAPNGNPTNLNERQWLQVRTKNFKEWFGDWEKDPENASKVVDENGEPLVVYHGTQSEFYAVDFSKSDDKISFFATSYDDTADTYGLGKMIKLFFNMRNPYIINGLGQAWDKLVLNDEAYSKEQLKQPYKLKRLTTGDIVKYAKEHGYDGVIFKDIIDNGQYTGMVYENQILQMQQLLESSIENKEYAVSKMYDFFSEISSDVFAILKSENQARFTIDNFTTDNTDKFSRIDCDVTLSDIIAKSDETWDDGLSFNRNANKKDDTNENVTDSISQNTQRITKDEALKVFQKLQSVIPSLKEIKFLSNEEILRMTGGVRANAFVKNGIVYVNKAGFNSKDTVIEECLHSFVNDLSIENKRLFNSLLRRAIKDFPKLVASIFENYSDKDGFTQEDRNQELVTQVLSRYMRKELENPSKSLLRNIQNFITWLVEKLQKLFKDPKTGKYIIDANFFINGMTFEDIAKILNSGDVQVKTFIDDKTRFNIFNRQSAKKRFEKAKQKLRDLNAERIKVEGVRTESQKLMDSIIQDIASGATSKRKAYNSQRNKGVSYGDEKQAVKNQEFENTVKQRVHTINELINAKESAKVFTEKANMILDFVEQADDDIYQALAMLQNVKDNGNHLLYYNYDANGNKVYQDPNGNSITAATATNKTISAQFQFDDIQYITTDVLGYYSKLLSDIERLLQNIPAGTNPVIDHIKNTIQQSRLGEALRQASNMKLDIQQEILNEYIDKKIYEQTSSELSDDMKQRLSINMKKWVKAQYDFGDVKAYQGWLMMVSDSKSPIVRMIGDEITRMNMQIDRTVEPKAQELEKLLLAAEKEYSILGKNSAINVMTKLMQKDRNGFYNGDFVQPINRRQYFQDLEDFKSALLYGKNGIEDQVRNILNDSKYELELDEYREPIFPEDPKFDSVYKDYKTKMESFICDHANRRFTKKYYLDRINALSVTTIKALDQVNNKINKIKSSATIDGKFRPDLLNNNQIALLSQLQNERQQLANFYDVDGAFKDPNTEEGKIAAELQAWTDQLKGKVKYTYDLQSFNNCLNNIKDKAQRDRFLKVFSTVGLNPKMYDDIYRYEYIGNDKNVQDLLDKAKDLRKKLRNLLQLNNVADKYIRYNWNNLFDIKTGEPKNIKILQQIKDIDEQLDSVMSYIKGLRKHDKKDPVQVAEFKKNWKLTGGVGYDDRFITMQYGSINIDPSAQSNQVVYPGSSDSVYNLIHERYVQFLVNSGKTQAEALVEADKLLTNNGAPLSIFEIQMPKNKEFSYTDKNNVKRKEYSFVFIPSRLFSKIDSSESSDEYVNKQYNEQDNNLVQPMEQYYKDDRYDYVQNHPKLKALYDSLTQTMNDIYDIIPYSSKYDMRLPQIGANTAAILTRNMSSKYGLQTFKNMGNAFARFANATENDNEYYIPEYNTRPDGSAIKNIPIKYINRINDSNNISSDLVGTVVQMYRMAINYKIKSENSSRLETILGNIEENRKDKDRSVQEKIIGKLLDRQLYEKDTFNGKLDNMSWEDPGWFKKYILGGPKTFIKRIGLAKKAGTLVALTFRLVSQLAAWLDPFLSTMTETLAGRYYHKKDMIRSMWQLVKEFPKMLGSIGVRKSYSKTMAILDALKMTESVANRYSGLHHSRARKILIANMGMKGFEIGDYNIKALNVNAVYNTFRKYIDKNGDILWLNRYDYIQHCIQDGMNIKQAKKAYNSSQTARSSIYVKDGAVALENDLTKEQFLKIGAYAKKVTQTQTLVTNDEDRTWMQTNVWSSFVAMLRTFLLVSFSDRFRNQYDFIVGTDENGNLSDRQLNYKEIKQLWKDNVYYHGGYNFATGMTENGIFREGFSQIGKILKSVLTGKFQYLKMLSNVGNMTQDELASNKLSIQRVYAAKRIFLELSVVVACVTMSLLCQRYVSTLDPDDDDNYYWFLLNAVLMRLPIERVTHYNPQTISDIITSITTMTSSIDKLYQALDILNDIVGISGHDPDEIIKSDSAYKGQTRQFRALMNAGAIFGASGWYASAPKSLGGGGAKAIQKSTQWYQNTAPWGKLYTTKTNTRKKKKESAIRRPTSF